MIPARLKIRRGKPPAKPPWSRWKEVKTAQFQKFKKRKLVIYKWKMVICALRENVYNSPLVVFL
jgi:hypothetical protein